MAAGNAAIVDLESSPPPTRKRRDLFELSVGYALILLVIWTPRPYQRFFYSVAAAFLIAIAWRSFSDWRSMGLRTTNLLRSLWVVGIALAVSAMAVFVSIRTGTLHAPATVLPFIKQFWGYALWSFAQQILLQTVFLERLLRILPSRRSAVVAAAGIFALAHLPNPILTTMTIVWGLAACALFLRYRNIFPLALAHAIFGITLAIAIPGPVIRNMRVGLGYLRYRRPPQRSHIDHVVSTHAWAIADAPTRRS